MRALAAMLIMAVSGTAEAQTAGPQDLKIPEIPALTVTVDPPGALTDGVPVQSQVLLRIQIASRHAFEALQIDLPDIEGAETIRMLRPRTRKVRSYVGEGHVFETVLGVFPTRSGVLHLPPVRAAGHVEPEPGRKLSFDEASPARRIPVSGIPPDYGDGWWMASPRVEIAESWSRPPEELRDGDTVRREVRITAFGLTADRVALPEHRRTRWVSVADAGTTTRTELSATGAIGVVTRAWDLKIEQSGVVYAPPVGISYWHPGERARLRAALPGRRLEPLPADRAARAAALMAEARAAHAGLRTVGRIAAAVAAAALLAALAALAWRLAPTRADIRLMRRCASQTSADAIWKAVALWAEETGPDAARLPPSVAGLEAALFGRRQGGRPNGAGIARDCVRHARRARLARLRVAPRALADALLGPWRRLQPARPGLSAGPSEAPARD